MSSQEPVTDAPCEHRNGDWFDRSICPEPCGSMHTRCADCGAALSGPLGGGACYFESAAYREQEAAEELAHRHVIEAEAVARYTEALIAALETELTHWPMQMGPERRDVRLLDCADVLALIERLGSKPDMTTYRTSRVVTNTPTFTVTPSSSTSTEQEPG